MKYTTYLTSVFVLLTLSLCAQNASPTQQQNENIGFYVCFKENGTKPLKSHLGLDSLYNQYLKKTIESNGLVIIMFSANTKEYEKDKFIDLKRCQIIVEYYSKKFDLAMSQFVIRMEKPNTSDINKLINLKEANYVYLAPWR